MPKIGYDAIFDRLSSRRMCACAHTGQEQSCALIMTQNLIGQVSSQQDCATAHAGLELRWLHMP
ncbi:hypothetical protein DPMN_025944 [Dreissena polymorpha]|uniref:Uncharacterized protein n=1 Tax=Dreissena polymorpha TaxID=45954 RepID=A0A9D4LSF8_DREPO|nr:hypothetical protein DPMN_025944 [Dreissena polymorpha]